MGYIVATWGAASSAPTCKILARQSYQSAALEFEDDSDLGAEIVLGAVADYGGIAEAGANPININGAEGDVFAEWECRNRRRR